jgi:hypothetical protein
LVRGSAFAYNLTGDGKTLIRGGVGKVYQYTQTPILITLAQRQVIAPTLAYDTAQVTSPGADLEPSRSDRVPIAPRASTRSRDSKRASPRSARPCKDVLDDAADSGARRRASSTASRPAPSSTVPDRAMQYTWAFSFGVKRELVKNMAVSVDYVGNRGRDLTAVIDINEGPINPATGRVTRLGVNGFNPNNALNLPAAALAATFTQFNQEQTRSDFNTDFNSVEVELEKRFSNRWAGRVSYTYSRCNDVVAPLAVVGANDLNPLLDYGRCARDNQQAFASSANGTIWKGLGAGWSSAATRAIRSTRRPRRYQRRRHE